MHDVVALRPFVPAKDFRVSHRFYEKLGFRTLHRDESVAILELGHTGFILQNFYVEAFAANFMMQLMVRDLDAFWASLDLPARLAAFDVKVPIPPAMQHWGLRVGYIFDPSGVLWHVVSQPV